MRFLVAALLAIVCAPATAAAQDTRPSVLLLDGLFIYVHQQYVGVSALAGMLDRLGYRTLVDTHLMTRTANAAPDVIIGHSMGGSSALKYAGEMVAAGKPAPVIITIDAAFGSPACPVPRCINIRTPGFPDVAGAENIEAWKAGAFMVNHAMLATNEVVQGLVLREMQAIIDARSVPTPPLTAPIPIPRPQ
jgi:hypothetical protein